MKVHFKPSIIVFFVLLAQTVLAGNSRDLYYILPDFAQVLSMTHPDIITYNSGNVVVVSKQHSFPFRTSIYKPLVLSEVMSEVKQCNESFLEETKVVTDNSRLYDWDLLNPVNNLVATATMIQGVINIKLQWQAPDTANQKGFISDPGSTTLTGFNIYRTSYKAIPAGTDTAFDINKFLLIGTTDSLVHEYIDYFLPTDSANCATYFVKAVYSLGESVPSNIVWECLFVPNVSEELTIFPNPATSYFEIELKEGINLIEVFNLSGSIISKFPLNGETHYTYYFSDIVSGIYSIWVTSTLGNITTKKFLKY